MRDRKHDKPWQDWADMATFYRPSNGLSVYNPYRRMEASMWLDPPIGICGLREYENESILEGGLFE